MRSNGPTRHDKFAEAWAKFVDFTKKKKGEQGRKGRERTSGEVGGRKCMVGVRNSFFKVSLTRNKKGF